MEATVNKFLTCPSCGADVPVHPDFLDWCDCGWNLKPQQKTDPRGLVESTYQRIAARLAGNLHHQIMAEASPRPRTAAAFLAIALSLPVHLATLLFGAIGLALIVGMWPNPVALFLGGTFVFTAVFMRPSLGSTPEGLVGRDRLPTLYGLVDEVAAALKAPGLSGIAISTDFNAFCQQSGLRRRWYVTLGLPLVSILDRQALVFLLGHEIGHAVNGDPAQGLVVWSAINTLARWYWLIYPFEWSMNLFVMPLQVIGLCFATGLRAYMQVLITLIWRDSQRSEYTADLLGARAGGVAGGLALAEASLQAPTFEFVVRRVALNQPQLRFFPELHATLASLPERERERRRRMAQLEESRLDYSHPPTAHRMEFIAARPRVAPAVECGPERYQAIMDELRALEAEIETSLIDDYVVKISKR